MSITLNPGAGGPVVASDVSGGEHYQLLKAAGNRQSYWPGYSAPGSTDPQAISIDDGGALVTRGAVTSDEGTFRCNFANTSLAVSIGSVTVAGNIVTGTGFLSSEAHYRDYFKLSADAATAWNQIVTIDSDTQMTLASTYTGGASGTGERALMQPFTGTGGSIAVASGTLTLGGGTTASAVTGVKRFTDYAPLVFRARLSISQRIVNQEVHIGLEEDAATTRWFARFLADGTTNTTIKCETGRNPTGAPSASETETTTITLPNGSNTSQSLDYRVELLTESVRFYVQSVLVAEHVRVLPHQHDKMTSHVEIRNGGSAPGSNTNLVIDYITGKNHNKLEIGVLSDAERIVAAAAPLVPYTYSVAGVITINTDLLIIDCRQMRTVSLQAVSIGTTGRLDFFVTNDLAQIGTAQPAYPIGGAAAVTTTTAAGSWQIPTNGFAFMRIRLGVATTAGTTTLAAFASQTAHPLPAPTTQPVSGTITASGTVGTAAQGAAASGNPVLTGAVAKTAQPTARTDGQVVTPLFSKVGHAIVMKGQVRDLNDTNPVVTLSSVTETTLIAAVAAVFHDIYSLTIANTSATGVRVDLRSVAAGTVLDSFWVPPTTTLLVNPTVPYKQATVNTAWTVQLSAAVTDVRVSARSVRNV
jgi:hypothetical protein